MAMLINNVSNRPIKIAIGLFLFTRGSSGIASPGENSRVMPPLGTSPFSISGGGRNE